MRPPKEDVKASNEAGDPGVIGPFLEKIGNSKFLKYITLEQFLKTHKSVDIFVIMSLCLNIAIFVLMPFIVAFPLSWVGVVIAAVIALFGLFRLVNLAAVGFKRLLPPNQTLSSFRLLALTIMNVSEVIIIFSLFVYLLRDSYSNSPIASIGDALRYSVGVFLLFDEKYRLDSYFSPFLFYLELTYGFACYVIVIAYVMSFFPVKKTGK